MYSQEDVDNILKVITVVIIVAVFAFFAIGFFVITNTRL